MAVASASICKSSAPRSRLITTPAPHHSIFYRPDAFSDAQPTALKHRRQMRRRKNCQNGKNHKKYKVVKTTAVSTVVSGLGISSHADVVAAPCSCSHLAEPRVATVWLRRNSRTFNWPYTVFKDFPGPEKTDNFFQGLSRPCGHLGNQSFTHVTLLPISRI